MTLNTFIPQDRVLGGLYSGDNRSVGQPGTHRTQQQIAIGTGPDGQPLVTTTADIDPTHLHVPIIGIPGIPELDVTKTQSTDGLQERSREVLPDGTVRITLQGDSSNPLFPGAPAISYEMVVTAKRLPDGKWDVSVSGTHDSFPGYEVIAQTPGQGQEVLYGYDPRDTGAGPTGLAGLDGRVDVHDQRDVVGDGVSVYRPPPPPPYTAPLPTPTPGPPSPPR